VRGSDGEREEEEVGAEENEGVGKEEQWEKRKEGVLRVLQWNADGVWNKKAELEEVLARLKVGVEEKSVVVVGLGEQVPPSAHPLGVRRSEKPSHSPSIRQI